MKAIYLIGAFLNLVITIRTIKSRYAVSRSAGASKLSTILSIIIVSLVFTASSWGGLGVGLYLAYRDRL